MLKKTVLIIFCALFVYSLNYVYPVDPEKLLTISDVEKVTGQMGIKLIPRNPTIGAG